MHPRLLTIPHWRPWEESQAILGLEAMYLVTGEQGARDVAIRSLRIRENPKEGPRRRL